MEEVANADESGRWHYEWFMDTCIITWLGNEAAAAKDTDGSTKRKRDQQEHERQKTKHRKTPPRSRVPVLIPPDQSPPPDKRKLSNGPVAEAAVIVSSCAGILETWRRMVMRTAAAYRNMGAKRDAIIKQIDAVGGMTFCTLGEGLGRRKWGISAALLNTDY